MKRILVLALLFLVCLPATRARAGSEALAWVGWNEGLRNADKKDRPMLVDVYTDWCGWCKRMDRDVYAKPEVREYLDKHFITVKLNAEGRDAAGFEGKSYTSRTLATRFRVTGYPTTVFLRSNGEHLVNVPGYVPAERFLLLLRYVGEGHIDRGVDFGEFAKSAAPSDK